MRTKIFKGLLGPANFRLDSFDVMNERPKSLNVFPVQGFFFPTN